MLMRSSRLKNPLNVGPGPIDGPIIDDLNPTSLAHLTKQRTKRILDQMLLVVEDQRDRCSGDGRLRRNMGGSRIHLPVNRLDLEWS